MFNLLCSQEEGDENKVPALSMVRDLCEKGADNFMDHFCRLGVINHISKRAKVFAEEKLKSDKVCSESLNLIRTLALQLIF